MCNSLAAAAAVAFLGFAASLEGQTCVPAVAPKSLAGQRPLEINTGVAPGTCGFLQFAWQDFLALSWPPLTIDPNNGTSQSRGLPDPSQVIGQNGDNPTVWEQDQPNWYLFQPNNPPPTAVNGNSFAAWNKFAALPSACGPQNLSPPPRILSSLSKFDAMPGVAQAFSAPMIDQDGYYARYEIVLDYPAFNYVNSNQFYLLSNVTAFAQKGTGFSFPVQNGSTPGATFIKAAWKTLSAAEINSGRYHTAKAFLFTPSATGLQQTCAGPVTVGLVGLHIVHKTQDFANYLWATFEQVDNTPADPSNLGPTPPEGWGFFKPGSSTAPNKMPGCPATGVSPPPFSCDFQPTSSHLGANPNDKTGGPTQAVRLNPIPKSPNNGSGQLLQINAAVQSALQAINASSVWQFYELVDAQWQTSAPPQTCASAGPFFPPNNVANMTMETYHQTGSPISSCMTCHKGSTAPSPPAGQPPAKVCSDMTFELTLAWAPTQLPAGRVPGLKPSATHVSSAKSTKKEAEK
ncbi:MAG: hypothetical protein ABSG65_04780 [Bryobacteraceae bacterium]